MLLEHAVEASDAGKAAGTVDLGDVPIGGLQKLASLFQTEQIQKGFEIHAEPLVKQRRKIVIFIAEVLGEVAKVDVVVQVFGNVLDDAADRLQFAANLQRGGVFDAKMAHGVKQGDAQILLGLPLKEQLLF